MWTPLCTFGPAAILDCLPARAMTANETPGVARLAAAKHRHRIHRRRAFADLEMELRRVDIAGLAGLGDHLAPLDRIAPLDHQLLGMSVGGDVAIRMPDQHEIAIALQLAAGIGNDAVLGRFHRRSFRDCEINAVILLAVGAGPKPAMMRALTGQRKDGGAPSTALRLPVAAAGASPAGVTTLALW